MQKLLRRSPSGPILCTAGSAPFLSQNPFLKKAKTFLVMPASAAAALSGGSSVVAAAASRSMGPISGFSSRFASSASCCICRCSAEKRTPFRAWVVSKDGRVGFRTAWLHTVSDGSFSVAAVEGTKSTDRGSDCSAGDGGDDGDDVDNGEKEQGLGEKPLRLNRRQRGSSAVGALAGNPDLLTIPGVGPRNLRKLVEKGIAGLAELKQLYKDKV